MNKTKRIIIVPCSGIGKTYGTVSREAAYEVIEELRPQTSQLVPLSKLVLGDEEARTAVSDNQVITIDGCSLACAAKMVKVSNRDVSNRDVSNRDVSNRDVSNSDVSNSDLSDGAVAREFAVLDAYRRHRKMKPRGIAELNEGGQQLAHVLAEEVAEVVDELQGGQDA
jgi:uncharacterized metal-binding protein